MKGSVEMPEEAELVLDISEYVEAAESLADVKSELVFSNKKPNLAAIVMATIVKFSKVEVRIFDNCLDGDIADQDSSFINEVNKFLKSGGKVRVALNDTSEQNTRVYEKFVEFANEFPSHFEVRKANQDFRNNIKEVLDNPIFFTIGDRTSYRIETTVDIKNERDAICCFHGPEIAAKLAKSFDKAYNQCAKWKIPRFA